MPAPAPEAAPVPPVVPEPVAPTPAPVATPAAPQPAPAPVAPAEVPPVAPQDPMAAAPATPVTEAPVNYEGGKERNKWVAFLLCFFLGPLGIHKFYDGKIGMGILYIVTCGLFGIGVLIDLIKIIQRPNPYYV